MTCYLSTIVLGVMVFRKGCDVEVGVFGFWKKIFSDLLLLRDATHTQHFSSQSCLFFRSLLSQKPLRVRCLAQHL